MKSWLKILILNICCFCSNSYAEIEEILWQPIVEMDNQIFPVLPLATATQNDMVHDSNSLYRGDRIGTLGIKIQTTQPNLDVKLKISSDNLIYTSELETTLQKSGSSYLVFPKLTWNYETLLSANRTRPINILFEVFVDNEKEEYVQVSQLRTINEAPYRIKTSSGQWLDFHKIFAAYVDENNPLIDKVLNAALRTGVIDSFVGYQRGEQAVYKQVFAIWHIMQLAGVKYSSITDTSAVRKSVYSQNVRMFEDTIDNLQANCVDGTVLFASILKKIGIDSYLVIRPRHMYLAFDTKGNRSSLMGLETTMMGIVNLRQVNSSILGSLTKLLGANPAYNSSVRSFNAAVNEGQLKLNNDLKKIKYSTMNTGYHLVDIEKERNQGIQPVTKH